MVVPIPPDQARTPAAPGSLRPEPAKTIHSPDDRLDEAVGLANAIDLEVACALITPITKYRPATLLGPGKIEELAELVSEHKVELVIIDHALSPVQQRNLETELNAKVLDRTGLILEIFGRRAQTKEGVLQVELAHLTYQRSRLVRSWTHLERQRGGAGFLGGPGESQLELDRRMLQQRIDKIRQELDVVVRTRELHRAGRRRIPYPVIAIVGYTNAGKSTLFNRLSGASVLAQDQVFATLDPTMREIRLPSRRRVIISDTVGFISDLPTMLVAAFKATLEEVTAADIVLHVRDISHSESAAQCHDVEQVLRELGLDTGPSAENQIEVWNKVDLVPDEDLERLTHQRRRTARQPAMISALTGEGVSQLLQIIDEKLGAGEQLIEVLLPPTAGAHLSWLYEHADVLDCVTNDAGWNVCQARISKQNYARLIARLTDGSIEGSDVRTITVEELEAGYDPCSSFLASSQSSSISSSDD